MFMFLFCYFSYTWRCRNRDFATIIPHQPAKYRERHNEVFLDFEAFLLSTMKERSTLWIHSQIKACMDANDCQPVRHYPTRSDWYPNQTRPDWLYSVSMAGSKFSPPPLYHKMYMQDMTKYIKAYYLKKSNW